MKRRIYHRPERPAVVDTVGTAIRRAQALAPEHVQMQRAITETALDNLRQGHDCAAAWRSLVDAANMSSTLASMGLGGGQEAQRVVRDAIAALAAVQQRQASGGSWTLHTAERDALHWLLRLHNTAQLPACSYGEFHRAMHLTNERVQQALAGNAAPGATVVVGDLAGQRLGA